MITSPCNSIDPHQIFEIAHLIVKPFLIDLQFLETFYPICKDILNIYCLQIFTELDLLLIIKQVDQHRFTIVKEYFYSTVAMVPIPWQNHPNILQSILFINIGFFQL